jgi:hypothetical protein
MPFDSVKTIRDPLALLAVERTTELELWDAWVFAAGDATRAMRAWEDAEIEQTAAAYVVYRAALDREERAAVVLGECVEERLAAQSHALLAA